ASAEKNKLAKKHVFLSYCRDNKSDVSRLRQDLIDRGEPVWSDQDITPGKNWKQELRQGMTHAYAVVACFSKEVEARTESGMFPELREAIEAYKMYAPGSIYLIPVRLSDCTIPDFEIDSTSNLSSIQYVDLFPESDRSAGLNSLTKALRQAPHHP
ncbi:MAG: toll/interleukin-1 receptor domain-containing protein, partial [Betaproteobacteria bacterium]